MRYTLFIICYFLSSHSFSQNTLRICNYYGNQQIISSKDLCKSFGYVADSGAEEAVEDIMSQIGLKANFELLKCNHTKNAFALNLKDEKVGQIRYIVYDSLFLDEISLKAKTNWGAVSVLAHEIGHHLNGHTLDGDGSRPYKELESDEFSGFVLRKLGASLDEALAAMKSNRQLKANSTHPGRKDRLAAIEKGWNNADALKLRYQAINASIDYGTIAKKWFLKAYEVTGNTEGHHVQRIAYYTKAIEHKADYAVAYRNRAKYHNILREYIKALNDVNQAIAIDPEQWNAYSEKGAAYFGLKRYQKAISQFNYAIEHKDEPDPYDYAARGWAYFQIGQKKEAAQDLKKALALKPNWQSAAYKLSRIQND